MNEITTPLTEEQIKDLSKKVMERITEIIDAIVAAFKEFLRFIRKAYGPFFTWFRVRQWIACHQSDYWLMWSARRSLVRVE